MLFEECNHRGGLCPCIFCSRTCNCCSTAPDGYAVDTDRLCKRAKEYCESGRENDHDR